LANSKNRQKLRSNSNSSWLFGGGQAKSTKSQPAATLQPTNHHANYNETILAEGISSYFSWGIASSNPFCDPAAGSLANSKNGQKLRKLFGGGEICTTKLLAATALQPTNHHANYDETILAEGISSYFSWGISSSNSFCDPAAGSLANSKNGQKLRKLFGGGQAKPLSPSQQQHFSPPTTMLIIMKQFW
jgi:hypothetical protein